ncbi:hypothetical protein [sulfur-oxidizing endosymbiont of Gigantopelta aegis]|uniref:hypothetical protein n=1 Tax=sulfur-oxidizing endosymbiont of Gigantopelta aegis TaxID=2794934 RepID=UPI0018DC52A8|nr:hypothetical protein [sulfur-oxidizing endosymbiont of Gigantopelta aegis]
MSNEQNKDSLLVDQKDALSFYFDALLLPDENELSENFAVKEQVPDEVLLPSDDNLIQAEPQEIIVLMWLYLTGHTT